MAEITVLIHDKRFKPMVPMVKRGIEAVLAKKRLKKAVVTAVLTDDAEIKQLNAQYRGKNKPTNVLSFPNGSVVDGVKQLGDIILAYETIVKEAKVQKKSLKDHVLHLAIHGTLHLLGHDHEDDKEAEIMESLEIKILHSLDVANPYESA